MRETEAEVYVNDDDDGGGGKGDKGVSSGGGNGGSGEKDGGAGGCGAGDSSDDDDEEERKLSTVQELSELNAASPPMSLAMCQGCERSLGEPPELRRDSDQPSDRDEAAISSISERVEARAKKEGSCLNEEHILSYADSPTFSEFSS